MDFKSQILVLKYWIILDHFCSLEIPLDKEVTANRLVETCTKLQELVLAVEVKCRLTSVQLPWQLQQSLKTVFRRMVCLGP